jgi:hypothetical protein
MAETSLRDALTNATYEFLGHKYRELFEAVRRDKPWLHGSALAADVLRWIDPGLARDVQREGGIPQWVDRRGGERPRVGTRERIGSLAYEFVYADGETSEDNAMKEDLRWVGLAVLIAVASGALWLLLRKRGDSASAPASSVPPQALNSRMTSVRIALAVFSGKVRDVGGTTATAGDLLTHAAFWWAGPADGWERLARTAALSSVTGPSESDDALLVMVYEAPTTDGDVPSSRPEGATRLRDAARAGELRLIGTFAVSDPTNLSAAGFRR